ncbi:MAG: hypothetical protein J1E06_05280 [Acutalibacter sp.]|nr:hypothetical protein [Acutalibacter sp.]
MWNKEKIMRLAERALKRTEPYLENRTDSNDPEDNFQLDYVLVKRNSSTPDTAIAYAHLWDELISFHPLDSDPHAQNVWEWAFSFDRDLFEYLEQGYGLAGMSLEAHCAAWSEIEEYHEGDGINHTKGMQQYLDYCKRNKVTVELLRREFQYEGMDVMILYDKSAAREKPSQAQER